MYETVPHQQLLNSMEAEFANAGFIMTAARRWQMAFVLERLDRARTREETEALCADLERELRHMSNESATAACDPEEWRGAAECA